MLKHWLLIYICYLLVSLDNLSTLLLLHFLLWSSQIWSQEHYKILYKKLGKIQFQMIFKWNVYLNTKHSILNGHFCPHISTYLCIELAQKTDLLSPGLFKKLLFQSCTHFNHMRLIIRIIRIVRRIECGKWQRSGVHADLNNYSVSAHVQSFIFLTISHEAASSVSTQECLPLSDRRWRVSPTPFIFLHNVVMRS